MAPWKTSILPSWAKKFECHSWSDTCSEPVSIRVGGFWERSIFQTSSHKITHRKAVYRFWKEHIRPKPVFLGCSLIHNDANIWKSFCFCLVQKLLLQMTQNFPWTFYYRESYKEFTSTKQTKAHKPAFFVLPHKVQRPGDTDSSRERLQSAAPCCSGSLHFYCFLRATQKFAAMKARVRETVLKLKAQCPLEVKNRNKPTLALDRHLQ